MTWGPHALRVVCVLGLGLHLAAPASAGGVAVQEHGRGLGNAYAGRSAVAEDASTVFWNPAGMIRLERNQLTAATYVASPSTRFRDAGSTDAVGGALLGDDGGNGGAPIALPSVFGVYGLSPRLKLGAGVNVPFGLSTDYGDTWIGRYHATKSEIEAINVSAVAAWRVNRCWTLGGGVDVQRLEASIGNAIDFGSIGAGVPLPGFAPQGADGGVMVAGDDWSIGFNVGLLFEPRAGTRFGLHYRSRIRHELEGEADFHVPPAAAPLLAGGAFVDTPARVGITMPDTLSFSAYHEPHPCWAVMADVTWTNWSVFDQVRIDYANPAQAPTVLDFDWRDTWRFSVGLTWRATPRWTLRGGLAYDPSPIPRSTRTPRIPGNDRTWFTCGAGFRVNERLTADLSYAYIAIDDGPIDQTAPARGRLVGHNETSVHLVGLQLTLDL